MRPHSVGERAALASSNPSHQIKVEIQDADGAWVDWTSYVLPGTSWGEERETPVATATVVLHRGKGAGSLSPLMEQSLLNRDSAAAYAPAIEAGRGIRISTLTGPDGWVEVFTGRVNRAPAESDVMQVSCSDLGAWLTDTQIHDEAEYGSPAGILLETILQEILDDNPNGKTTPTLVTASSPAYYATTFTQSPVKLLEALRKLALERTGRDVRHRYDAAGVSQLVFHDPDRARTAADWSIGTGEYHLVPRLVPVDIEPIRTEGRVQYRDASGTLGEATYDNAAARALYGRRWFSIPPQEGLDTLTEAQSLADAAGADMSGPGVEFSIETLYVWFAQLFDLVEVAPDDRGYDVAQNLAIAAVRHTWQGGNITTRIDGTSRIVGAYAAWRRLIRKPGTAEPDAEPGSPTAWLGELSSTTTAVTLEAGGTASDGVTPALEWQSIEWRDGLDAVPAWPGAWQTSALPT
ncbi:MAG: hypothetical protein H0X64_13765, partial [Gemmatimonadaceae bacterium]|nr:hypothetical protein [Gemmatimonadaceae bacterium]